jgi:hypothetical protein
MKRVTIEVEYEIGQIVYLTTDPEQNKFLVTAYKVESDCILYEITAGLTSAYASSIMLSQDRSVEFL